MAIFIEEYNEVYSLFQMAVQEELLGSDFIQPIEQMFKRIRDSFPELQESQQPDAPASGETYTHERYTEIVRAFAIAELLKKANDTVAEKRTAIANLETVPESWNRPKKEYTDSIRPALELLRQQRDAASQFATRLRNDDLTPDDAQKVAAIVERERSASNGTPTREQIEMRLSYLLDRAFTEESQNEQFYPTPDDIIDSYIIEAIKDSEKVFDRVLEPSAGRGNIADMLRKHNISSTNKYDVCEINPLRREILMLKNYRVVGDDFLQYTPPPFVKYDLIVMNPPFGRGEDIRHIKHAYSMLNSGGMLIALMSEGSLFSETRKDATAFRNWIKKNADESPIMKIIYSDEYNLNHDRKILINIGFLVLEKPYAAEGEDDGSFIDIEQQQNAKSIIAEYARQRIDIDAIAEPQNDADFVQAQVILSNAELSQKAKSNFVPQRYKDMPFIKPHVIDGVNLACESLTKRGGFLLADGTGAGKTIQCLLVAEHFIRETGKPVLIMTVDDRVIQTGVFADAQKLGMRTPDKINLETAKIPRRPKNYAGLYDGDTDATEVRLFRFSQKKLWDKAINVCTYNELSTWSAVDTEMDAFTLAKNRAAEMDKVYRGKRQQVKDDADKLFPKVNGKRVKKGYAEYVENALAELSRQQRNERVYVDMVNAENELKEARLRAAQSIVGESCLLILDEAHKIKNVGKVGSATAARAEMGFALTETIERVMFVTATPCDRAGDVLYLKKAGLFKSTEQFEQLMTSIGYAWSDPKTNDAGDIIRSGFWKPEKEYPEQLVAEGMGRAFDTLTEEGCMIRRELEMRNLDVVMDNVTVPQAAHNLMQSIEDNLTPDDDTPPNYGEIYLSQLIALEQYKLARAIELTQEAIAAGRSVIIWVSTVMEGKEATRATGDVKSGSVELLKKTFAKMYGEDKVGVIVGTHGEYEEYRRLENVSDFQDRKRRILIGTITSGGTGLNLDDTVGNAPRTMIVVTSPLSFINVVQAVGRIVRANTKSRSVCRFLFADDVAVDDWLKSLLAMKFVTLNATVKGEMKALSLEQMRSAENSGESAVIAASDNKALQKRKHSRFTKSNSRFEGWTLPSKVNIYVELSGTPKSTLISIGARSQPELDVWVKENAQFIQDYGLEFCPDEHYRKYNSRYYGKMFRERDNAYDLWNACLNIVMPESFAYRSNTLAAFKVGDTVRSASDLFAFGVAANTTGTVLAVRKNQRTISAKGDTVDEWYYDVKFGDTVAKRLESKYLLDGVPKPVLITKGMEFEKSYDVNNRTYYIVTDSDAYNVSWKGTREWMYYGRKQKNEYEQNLFVEEVIAKLQSGEIECKNCNADEITGAVLADNQDVLNDVRETYEIVKYALDKGIIEQSVYDAVVERLKRIGADFTNSANVIPIGYLKLKGVYGNETTIETPAGSIPAQYAVVPLHKLIASHNPFTWKENPEYPVGCQQRDYSRDTSEQQKVLNNAKNFDARFLLADVPTPDNGAPIVNEDGIVLGGNSRVMTLNVLNKQGEYQKYLSKLWEYMRQRKEYEDEDIWFSRPVLVRVIDVPIHECATFNNRFNTNFTQAINPVQKGVSMARQLTPEQLQEIGDMFAADDVTVTEMFSLMHTRTRLVRIFRDASIITDSNKNEWLTNTGDFTELGKMFVKDTLLGSVLPDKRYIEAAKNYTDKILKTIPLMMRLQRLNDEYNLMPFVLDAIKHEQARRSTGMTVENYLNQQSFDRPDVSNFTRYVWCALNSTLQQWRKFIGEYVRIAEQEQERATNGDMFNSVPLSRYEAILAADANDCINNAAMVDSVLHTQEIWNHRKKSASLSDAATDIPELDAVVNQYGCPPMVNGERCITDDCIRALDACIEQQSPTKWANWDYTQNDYTPMRKKLHEQIIAEFTKNKPCVSEGKPIAILTGGASGSGKSTLLKKYVKNLDKYLMIDIDKMREYLPEYKGWNADITQAEVKDIYNQLIDSLGSPCSYNIVVDGTMNKAKSYTLLLEKLRRLGYEIHIMYVEVTKEQSLQRALDRYKRSGRYVPRFVIDEIFVNGTAAFDEIKQNATGYIRINNSGDKNPVVVEDNNFLKLHNTMQDQYDDDSETNGDSVSPYKLYTEFNEKASKLGIYVSEPSMGHERSSIYANIAHCKQFIDEDGDEYEECGENYKVRFSDHTVAYKGTDYSISPEELSVNDCLVLLCKRFGISLPEYLITYKKQEETERNSWIRESDERHKIFMLKRNEENQKNIQAIRNAFPTKQSYSDELKRQKGLIDSGAKKFKTVKKEWSNKGIEYNVKNIQTIDEVLQPNEVYT